MATSIRLEPELEERYKNLAAKTGRSQTYYMRQALANEIDELEEIYDVLQTVEECRAGKQETYSVSEVREQLGL